MAAGTSSITKKIARTNPELASKGRLLFKQPISEIILGVELYGSRMFPHNFWVGCVILPTIKPTNYIYYENGMKIGFAGHTRLIRGRDNSTLWSKSDDSVDDLAQQINEDLMPHWRHLSDAKNCIDYFSSLGCYIFKTRRMTIESLICLTAHIQDYERCMSLIQEHKQHFPAEEDHITLKVDSYPRAYQQRIDLIENCINSRDFEKIQTKLREWREFSLSSLGLEKFG